MTANLIGTFCRKLSTSPQAAVTGVAVLRRTRTQAPDARTRLRDRRHGFASRLRLVLPDQLPSDFGAAGQERGTRLAADAQPLSAPLRIRSGKRRRLIRMPPWKQKTPLEGGGGWTFAAKARVHDRKRRARVGFDLQCQAVTRFRRSTLRPIPGEYRRDADAP